MGELTLGLEKWCGEDMLKETNVIINRSGCLGDHNRCQTSDNTIEQIEIVSVPMILRHGCKYQAEHAATTKHGYSRHRIWIARPLYWSWSRSISC